MLESSMFLSGLCGERTLLTKPSTFSIGAVLLIQISAIYASGPERIVEAAYDKILGSGKVFVFKVSAFENLLIGLFSAKLALAMSQAGTYCVCTLRLDIDYHWQVLPSLALVGATVALVVAVGLGASRSIMERRPVTYLREQAE